MSSPYRVGAPPMAPPKRRSTLGARMVLVAGLLVGSVGIHAFDMPAHLHERELQQAWSEVATCFVGPPLEPSETPSLRIRARRLAALSESRHDPRPPGGSWPRRCSRLVDAMIGALDVEHAADAELQKHLQKSVFGIDDVDFDAMFGAARARGLGHASPVDEPTSRLPTMLRLRPQAPFDRGVVDLSEARPDRVHGPNPTILFAGGTVPRICRWSTHEEPLDRVACWDAPSPLGRSFLRVDGASLEGADPLVFADFDGAYDAFDGAPFGWSTSAASRSDDGSSLVLELGDRHTSLRATSAQGEEREVLGIPGRMSGLALTRDVVWVDHSEKGRFGAGFVHLDIEGRALSRRGQVVGWELDLLGCEGDGTRGFAVGSMIAVAGPGRPFSLPASAQGEVSGEWSQLACLPGGKVSRLSLEGPGRRPLERDLGEWRCTEERCSLETVAMGDLVPDVDVDLPPSVADATTTMGAAAVAEDVVVLVAVPGAGVIVRRAPLARLATTPAALLIDDVEIPTQRVHVVSDGRGAVALLDDGQVVRALRLRPDGRWVPQHVDEAAR